MTELITIEELEKEIIEKTKEIEDLKDKYGFDIMDDGEVKVNSLQVANWFEKQHKDVLKKIRELINDIPELINERNLSPIEYIDNRNRKQTCYLMDRTGFSMLGLRFSGKKFNRWTYNYVKTFESVVKLLREILELTSKREQLLIEKEKHYLYSKDYKDYCIINNICGFSTNYLFEPVINWNNPNKPKMVKTQAYSLWSKQFKEKTHDKLIDYVKENNIDLTKNIYITFVMKYPEKLDLVNLEKGLIDQITLILQDLEPNFDDVQVKALYMRTGGGGSAKDYNDSIIAIRIQN